MAAFPILDGPRLAPASGRVRALVVMIHGYGSNGHDLIQFAPHWAAVLPDVAFVAPNAPQPCVGAPGGFQWWPFGLLIPAALAAGAAQAGPVLDAFLDAELARHALAPDRLVLAGFSQGAMMALQVGLRRTAPISGIVGYSGALADVGTLAHELRSRPPVLLLHGEADPVVPVVALHLAQFGLAALGVDVTVRLTPGLGHGIDAGGIAAGAAFAARVLGIDHP